MVRSVHSSWERSIGLVARICHVWTRISPGFVIIGTTYPTPRIGRSCHLVEVKPLRDLSLCGSPMNTLGLAGLHLNRPSVRAKISVL